MQIRRIDADTFMVGLDAEPVDVLHVNRYTPRQVQELSAAYVPRRPKPDQPGALATYAGLLPFHYVMDKVTIMPEIHGSWIEQPWSETRGSALLLPKDIADELSLRRSMSVKLLADPDLLRVSPIGDVLRCAAKQLLAHTQPEELMRVAMHFAFACEIAHRPWARAEVVHRCHDLQAPEPDRPWLRNRAEVLVEPPIVRVIALDAACMIAADTRQPAGVSLLSPTVRTLLAGFLPSLVDGQPPSPSEIRTAIWVLSYDSPFEIVDEDAPSMLMANAFGRRSSGEPHLSPSDWASLVSLPDNHRDRSWGPGQAPSDLRAELLTASGLDLRVVAMIVTWMLDTMVQSQHSDNQLWTLPALAARFREQHDFSIEPVLEFIEAHLVFSADALREVLLIEDDADESRDAAEAKRRAVERRKQIEQSCFERPFIRFGDGSIIPVAMADVSYRTIELCQEPHNDQKEDPNKRRRRIGGLLGHCFEAKVKELCRTIGHGHFVIDSDTINEVIDRRAGRNAKRGDDVVIGNLDGNYLVVEATKRNQRLGIRYAEHEPLEQWAEAHRGKHQQALNTARHLRQITKDAGFPPPNTITTLVVGDLVLPQNAALSDLLNRGSDEPHPPFLCSLTEFKSLVELGQLGFGVPEAARAWQSTGTDESMSVFLSNYPLR
ncbi:MAG: hypothetical protein OXF61_11470 [Acidimicrobiaceae bacterium]|nr:hypothetical protein [Acidimicrobiaceae bacterium]